MSDIALYEALTKLGLEPNEAKEAVADVVNSKDIATKDYIDAAIAKLETRMTWKLVILGIAIVGIIKYL